MRIFITLFFSLIFTGTALADSGSYYIGVRAGADVLASPDKSSDVIGHLPRLSSVKILEKRRNWRKIETLDEKRQRGWVYEGAIRKRYQRTQSSKKSSFFSSFVAMFRSPAPTQKTAVLGVRGFDEDGTTKSKQEDMEHAKKVVQWMDSLHVEDEAVAAFVAEGDLNP